MSLFHIQEYSEIVKIMQKKLILVDSGGGLMFPSLDKNRVIWYLRGIVSTGARNIEGSCDSNEFSTFTNILFHEKFIMAREKEYRSYRCCNPYNQTVH